MEVSSTFTAGDIVSFTGAPSLLGPQTSTPGSGNPFMPGPLFGLKWDNMTGTDLTVTLTTLRSPVWGDVYIKDGGGNDSSAVTAWNQGFLIADPTSPAANGTVSNHVLVPDTLAGVPAVPEPATLMLLGTGLGALMYRRRRRPGA